jgi:hypothetical protein
MEPDLLNPTNYSPPALRLAAEVRSTHASLVFRETNLFVLPTGEESVWRAYYVGLVGVPAALLAALLAVLLALLAAPLLGRCCRCARVREARGARLIAFSLFVTLNLGVWALLIGSLVTLHAGTGSYGALQDSLLGATAAVANVTGTLRQASVALAGWHITLGNVVDACGADGTLPPTVAANFSAAVAQLNGTLGEGARALAGVPTQVLEALGETLSGYSQSAASAHRGLSVCHIVVVALLWAVSVLHLVLASVLFCRKERGAPGTAGPPRRCGGACRVTPACGVVLALALLFAALLGVLAVGLQVVGQVASDACAPQAACSATTRRAPRRSRTTPKTS